VLGNTSVYQHYDHKLTHVTAFKSVHTLFCRLVDWL
jgi:hypothetical protein